MNGLQQPRSVLEVRKLHGGWGPTTVVENVSLALAAGETVSIIGRNGVGKSTLLELIVGRAQRRGGRVQLGRRRCRARRRPTGAPSWAGLCAAGARGVSEPDRAREISRSRSGPGPWTEERVFAMFPALPARLRSLGWQLSGGEQQMLSIARALMGNPKVLLMDEPTEGLAPVIVEQLVAAIRGVVGGDALTVLLVEQRVDIVLELSTRCMIMDRGRIVHEAASSELRGEPARLSQLIGLDAKV